MAQLVGGVQAPKYIYLPNATIRYNKLNYNYKNFQKKPNKKTC